MTWNNDGVGSGGNAGAPVKTSKYVFEGPRGYGNGGNGYWSQHQNYGGNGDGSGGGGGSSKDKGWGGCGGSSYINEKYVTLLTNRNDVVRTNQRSVPMIKIE